MQLLLAKVQRWLVLRQSRIGNEPIQMTFFSVDQVNRIINTLFLCYVCPDIFKVLMLLLQGRELPARIADIQRIDLFDSVGKANLSYAEPNTLIGSGDCVYLDIRLHVFRNSPGILAITLPLRLTCH